MKSEPLQNMFLAVFLQSYVTKGLFGWVANPWPGPLELRCGCLVLCFWVLARLKLASVQALAWLPKNGWEVHFSGAWLG